MRAYRTAMTTTTDRVSELFADAQLLYSDALEMLAQEKLRNAAEKAWGATKRSTDAMVLARTGQAPQSKGKLGSVLLGLGGRTPAIGTFHGQYSTRAQLLYLNCVCDANCEPEEEMTALIRATDSYIQEARNLASAV